MSNKTSIEWTEATWNPLRGCSRVSEGCRNCYAEKIAARFSDKGQPYEGLATRSPARWTGKVELIEKHLNDPLKWKTPRRIFVNSMSDLFHESVDDLDIQRIFDVMYNAPHHTFQILTKRAQRMHDYLNAHRNWWGDYPQWQHVHLGVSVEDQKTAAARIPLLLQTPAAVRFISAEPLLGAVNLTNVFPDHTASLNALTGEASHLLGMKERTLGKLDWVIVGGESGTGARVCDTEHIKIIVEQCKAAGVACFVKQLGGNVTTTHENGINKTTMKLQSKKGGDMLEWPESLRVRQMPSEATRNALTA